jgi:RimJ/RimL family protein N-acetyltransferase
MNSMFGQDVRLEGERVLLRPFELRDAVAIRDAARDGEAFLPPNVPAGGEPLNWWLTQGVHDLAKTGLGLHLAVVDRATGELSGAIGIFRVDWMAGAAESGYGVRPSARGRGLATDALRTIAAWVLGEAGLNRLELRINAGNAASLRVAEKAGFRHEGLLRSSDREEDGTLADQHVFSLLAADLAAARAAAEDAPARRLIGVGLGPGDPDLVTAKGIRVLRESDVVLVPVSGLDEESRAEQVVRAYTGKAQRVQCDVADIADAAERVARAFGEGALTVAFATIGDPNVYSSFTSLARAVQDLRPDVEVATVPGITQAQDLAAVGDRLGGGRL